MPSPINAFRPPAIFKFRICPYPQVKVHLLVGVKLLYSLQTKKTKFSMVGGIFEKVGSSTLNNLCKGFQT